MTYIIVGVLVILSGLFSGLTLGFFTLNKNDLERKARLGNKRAKKIFSLRKDGNLLLSTLLVGNVAVNTTLSIFLGSISSGVVAGIIATLLIVVFGEILPQATFARHALRVGASFFWLVLLFEIILYPICKPIALLLDRMLGEELPTVYSKQELVQMIEDHEDEPTSDIDREDERILKGVLQYSEKRVRDIMTPLKEANMVSVEMQLTKKNVTDLRISGHSRIPVFEGDTKNVVGILYAKDLLARDLTKLHVRDIIRRKVVFTSDNTRLDDLLDAFTKKRKHLFVVRDKQEQTVGVVTIEDVLEEIIGAEIVDEFDVNETPEQNT